MIKQLQESHPHLRRHFVPHMQKLPEVDVALRVPGVMLKGGNELLSTPLLHI